MRINIFTLVFFAALINPITSNASDMLISCKGDVYQMSNLIEGEKFSETKGKSYVIKNGYINDICKIHTNQEDKIFCRTEMRGNENESYVFMMSIDRIQGLITETFIQVKNINYYKLKDQNFYQILSELRINEARFITEFRGQCEKTAKPKF